MIQSPHFGSVRSGLTWFSVTSGFLTGFLIVFGWQAGEFNQTRSPQPSPEITQAPIRVPNAPDTQEASSHKAPSATEAQPSKTPDELVFEPRFVDQQLKAPLGRLLKWLQQCELRDVKTQQLGDPRGDTVVRVEVPPLSVNEVDSFWKLAETELLKLAPGLRSFFVVRLQEMQDHFLRRQSKTGVLFVKQRATRQKGEPSVLYWYFQTHSPANYALAPDGSIALPADKQLPEGTPWLDPSTYKAPQHLKHLAGFKFD
jgi:hypothetical protein